MVAPAKTSRLVTFATMLAVVASLYLARDVLIPFALAALVSFSLAPLAARLERLVGRVAGVITVVLLACGVLGGTTYLVAGQVTQLAEMLPQYRTNIAGKLRAIRGGAIEKATEAVKQLEEDVQAEHAEKKAEEKKAEQAEEARAVGAKAESPTDQRSAHQAAGPRPATPGIRDSGGQTVEPTKVQIVEPPPTSLELISGMFGPLLGPLGTGGMVIVLILFMLLARGDLRDRIVRLMGRGRINVTTQAMDEASERVSRYLLMQTVINGIQGVAVAAGMFLLDVPNYLLWGLLSAVLRFVPYVGPWAAAAMPILVSLAVFDNWTQPLMVLGYFVFLELVSNNLLEPWLYGSSAGVSPLAVILTSIFWAWLWGPIGLLLATPLTVCMLVMGKHVHQLHFVNILLGEEPALEPHARFYQRLVAMDYEEASGVAEKLLQQTGSLVEVYDTIVIPALGLAEMDRHGDQLDERRAQFIHSAVRDMVEDLAEIASARTVASSDVAEANEPDKVAAQPSSKNDKSAAPDPPPPLAALPSLPADFFVLALPAHDEADELVGTMLAQVVRACGGRCEAVSMVTRTSGMVDVVQQHGADMVCISALPPSAVVHARHVYKRLASRFPTMRMVMGLWNASKPIDQVRARVGSDAAIPVVRTLREAMAELDLIARTRPARAASSPTGAAAAG